MPVSPEGLNFPATTLDGVIAEIDNKLEQFKADNTQAWWPLENEWIGYFFEIKGMLEVSDSPKLMEVYHHAGWNKVQVDFFHGTHYITLCMHPSSPLLAKR